MKRIELFSEIKEADIPIEMTFWRHHVKSQINEVLTIAPNHRE
jgi:hypothetical protein